MAIHEVPWCEFRKTILALYEPPMRSANTWSKMKTVCKKLDALGIKTTRDFTPELVNRFLRGNTEWRPETIKGYMGYLSPLFKYAAKLRYCEINPLEAWDFSPLAAEVDDDEEQAREDAKHLSVDAIVALLDHLAAHAGDSWHAARINALTAFVAYTGVRRNEALFRKVEDFDLKRRIVWIRVRRKRRLKTRGSAAPVPFPKVLVPVLEEWLPRCGCEWAFPNAHRRPWTAGRPGTRPIDHIRRAGEEAGVGRVTFQMLRHSFATHGERWGLGELMLQRILRHTTTRTQARYRHADIINLADAVAEISYRRTGS